MSARTLNILNITTAVLMAASLGLVWFIAPIEATMGAVQKIFYFHLGAAWVGMVGFFITFVVGIIYLLRPNSKWDWLGAASAEVGLLLSIIATATGSIWARPAWNTWWTWDPRLTTYTIMALIYIAYMMLRQGIEDPQRRARFAAVYGIIGVISVPLTFFSIRWWRTIHPVVIGNGSSSSEGGFDMTRSMLQTFLFANLAFTFLYVALLANRVRLARLGERVEQLKARLLTA